MARIIALGGFLVLFVPSLLMAQGPERLSLSQAIALALERNPDCIAARASADASRARIWRGIAPPPPTLALTYDYIPTGSGIASYGERAVVLTQSFDFPSTFVLRGSALASEADAADGDVDLTALTVTLHVKRAYFTVLARTEKLRLAVAHAEIARDVAEKARIRANAGEASDLERLSARIQEVQAAGAVESAKNDLTLAVAELRLLLGHGSAQQGTLPILTDTLGHRHGTFDTDRLIVEASQAHPILKRARAQREAASTGRALAWSSFLPSFTLSYAQQMQGTMTGLYGVSLGITVPIWFMLDQRGQIQEANARYSVMASGLTGQVDALAHTIRNAYLDFTNEEREVHLYAEELLPQSEEVFRVAETSYQAGDIPYTEFLQARQTLISARVGFVDALLRHNTAFAQLEYAVGHDLSGGQISHHE